MCVADSSLPGQEHDGRIHPMMKTGWHLQRTARVLLAVLVVVCFDPIAWTQSPRVSSGRAAASRVVATKSRIANGDYGKLPLSFEPNRGQSDQRVKFLANGGTYELFLTQSSAVLELTHSSFNDSSRRLESRALRNHLISVSSLGINFVGGSPSSTILGLDQLPGKTDYFIGRNPKNWRTGVPSFRRVRYRDVYPGTDLVFYGNQHQLEFDCVLSPGADPHQIGLRIQGASHVRIDRAGNLQLGTEDGEIELRKPTIYQPSPSGRTEVAGRYVLDANDIVRFQIGDYDSERSLVVDPTLIYSTYLGGSSTEAPGGIAVDSQGDAFVGGQTLSTDFPTTSNAIQSSAPSGISNWAGFVTEINPTGTSVLYSTYLGGNGGDSVFNVALDSANPPNVYVTGSTCSTNFPTTQNGYSPTFTPATCTTYYPTDNFGGAAFITKFNPSISGTAALQYSTYLGGNGGDWGGGIAVDPSGNIYITGQTYSTNFPVTTSAFQSTNRAGSYGTAFVTRIDPTQSGSASLVYSTYLGGSGNSTYAEGEDGAGIGADSDGNVYLDGTTLSVDFPTTSSAFMQTAPKSISAPTGPATEPAGGGFVARIDTNASGTASLVYSTFLGGSCGDFPELFQALGPNNRVYVVASTCSSDFPITPGAYQTSAPGSVSTDGGASFSIIDTSQSGAASLVYSTFLGGSIFEIPFDVAIDSSGDAYIGGVTGSHDFPITSNALQTSWSGCASGFLSEIAPLGRASSDLVYSSYFSGTEPDCGPYWPAVDAITLDGAGSVYVFGQTGASNFPVTPNAFQTSLQSNEETYVAKFDFAPTVTSLSASSGTIGTSVTVTGTNFGTTQGFSTVTFNGSPATPTSWSDTSISVAVPGGAITGPVVVTVGGVASNGITFTVTGPNGYSYYRVITINHNEVPNTDQADFPVLISGTYPYLATTSNGGNVANANGYDIIFTSDGAGLHSLPYERESYTASTGAVTFWVQVPTLSHTADTVIYMWYGNPSVSTDQSNKTGAWDSNYVGVWHLTETLTGSGQTVHDSTSNANNLTSAGTWSASQQIAGEFGGALSVVSGNQDQLTINPRPASLQLTGDLTLEIWLNRQESASNENDFLLSCCHSYDYDLGLTSGQEFLYQAGYTVAGANTVSNYAWHFLAATKSGTAGTVYLDGASNGSGPVASTEATDDPALNLLADSNEDPYITGYFEEARISKIARSADWIATEYNNYSNPGAFYGVGAANGPALSALTPNSGAVGASVTITGVDFGATQGESTVTFNGTVATPTTWNNTSVVAPVPDEATTGPVVVTVGGVASNGVNFTVTGPPTITELSPTSGAIGALITIDGANFSSAQGSSTVTFNGTTTTPISWSNTTLTVRVPTGATTGPVVVTVGGVPSNAADFTVLPGGVGSYIVQECPSAGITGGHQTASSVTCSFPSNTTAGDEIVVYGTVASIVALSVTDSTSNTYTAVPFSYTSSSLPDTWGVWCASNIPGGTDTITLTASSTITDLYVGAVELRGSTCNVDAQNSSDANSATSTPISTSLANDIIFATQTGSEATGAESGATSLAIGGTMANLIGSTYHGWNTAAWGYLVAPDPVTNASAAFSGQTSVSNYTAIVAFEPSGGTGSAPSITSLSPNSGIPGTSVTITGANFGSAQGSSTVTFNGTIAFPNTWSSTSIVVPVPSGATTGEVVVTIGGIASNGVSFAVENPGPVVIQSCPNTGITGGLNTGTSVSCTFEANTSAGNQIVIYGTVDGNVSLTVADSAGNSYSAVPFAHTTSSQPDAWGVWCATNIVGGTDTVTLTASASISDLYVGAVETSGGTCNVDAQNSSSSNSPISGPITTSIANDIIFAIDAGGNGSSGPTGLAINGQTATLIGSTNHGLHNPGWGDLVAASTVTNATATFSGATGNSYVSIVAFEPASIGGGLTPTLTSLSPTSGAVGTAVTITGTGFASAQGSSTVTFNGTLATPTSWGNTTIVAPVPDGATTGDVVVTVSGVDSNGKMFTVEAAPTITSLSPTSGPIGTSVTITGTDFGSTQGSSTVTFAGTAATATGWSDTSITTTVPAGAVTGDVVVTVNGVPSNGQTFTVGATGPTVSYYVEDMLGSSRTIVQDGATSPCYDADFLPFGYEKAVVNTCSQNYKFEGKERDPETNNDNFGARYYSNHFGRWLSPDWSSVPAPVPYANLGNPQTLNLYAMVSDNPETFADLDGHGCGESANPSCDQSGGQSNENAEPCGNNSAHSNVPCTQNGDPAGAAGTVTNATQQKTNTVPDPAEVERQKRLQEIMAELCAQNESCVHGRSSHSAVGAAVGGVAIGGSESGPADIFIIGGFFVSYSIYMSTRTTDNWQYLVTETQNFLQHIDMLDPNQNPDPKNRNFWKKELQKKLERIRKVAARLPKGRQPMANQIIDQLQSFLND